MPVIKFFDENAHCPLSYSHQSPRTTSKPPKPTSVTQVALLGTPSHLPCCLAPVCSLKTPASCCLLQERCAFFVPMCGPAPHVSHHTGMWFSCPCPCPCPGLWAICRKTLYRTCVSIPSAYDSIQSKRRHKYLLDTGLTVLQKVLIHADTPLW